MSDWAARLALDLLTTAQSCYSGLDSPPLPTRAYVSFGISPALDCPSLVVSVTQLDSRPPPSQRCTIIPRLRLTVTIARCYPTVTDGGQPPAATAEQAASTELDADLSTLWDGLVVAWHNNTLFPSFDGINCEAVQIGIATALGPLGGLAGWVIPITIDLTTLRSVA